MNDLEARESLLLASPLLLVNDHVRRYVTKSLGYTILVTHYATRRILKRRQGAGETVLKAKA